MASKSPLVVPARPEAASEDVRELALLRRVAAGDRDALTGLYRIYHARLFKFLYRLTRSYSASDELVNDIMLVVWRSAPTFRAKSRVSTWIFGIAYRQAMRRLRRNRLRFVTGAHLEEPATDDTADAELKDWLQHALASLPAAQQLTVVLVFYLGLSYQEVAEVADCPVNTVKTRMYHARHNLRELLTRSEGNAKFGGRDHD
jgi:RNA polymerase sigma-70 factor, ECF subfamily